MNPIITANDKDKLIADEISEMKLLIFHQCIRDLLFNQDNGLSAFIPGTDSKLCAQLQFTGLWIQDEQARWVLDNWCREWLSFLEWKQLEKSVREKCQLYNIFH